MQNKSSLSIGGISSLVLDIDSSNGITGSNVLSIPLSFENIKISHGTLLIRSEDTNNWFSLTAHENTSGSFTTQLERITDENTISSSAVILTAQSTSNYSVSSSWSDLSGRSLVSNITNRISNGIVQIRNGFMFMQGNKGTWYKIQIEETPEKSGSFYLTLA